MSEPMRDCAAAVALETERCAAQRADTERADGAAPGWFTALAQPRFAIPAIAAFGALLFLLNLGGYPLYTKGEPREAVTILGIVNGGGVILPMRAGVEIPSKPLLMHWLGALVSIALGRVDEWSVRLPSAFLAIAGLLACYGYVRRLFDEPSALFSALILGTTVQYLQAGSGARVDMTLTFFMEVAFFEFLMVAEGLVRRRTPLYGAIALAVLTKGPVGLVLPALVAGIWIVAQRRWSLVAELGLGRGALIVGALAGSWYAAASIVGGMAFVEKQILAENLLRFFGGRHFSAGHAHPFYYLELALLGGFMPWTPLLVLVAVRAIYDPRSTEPRLTYLVTWFGTVLVFYSFATSKRGVYLLALYPALATIVALYLADAVRKPSASARTVGALSAAGGFALVAAGAGAMAGLVMLWLWHGALSGIFALFGISDPDFMTALGAAVSAHRVFSLVVPVAAAALGAFLLTGRSTAGKMGLSIAAGMALIVSAANVVVLPATANALTLKQFAAEITAQTRGHSLGYIGGLDYDLSFYLGRTIPIVAADDPRGPDYAICWRGMYRSLNPQNRARYRVIMTSHPTSLDNTGRMLLLKRVAAEAPADAGAAAM